MKSSFAPAKSKSFDDIILGQLRIGKNNWNIVRMVFRSGGGLEAVGDDLVLVYSRSREVVDIIPNVV